VLERKRDEMADETGTVDWETGSSKLPVYLSDLFSLP